MLQKPDNIVIDTNVILSRFLFPSSTAAIAIAKAMDAHAVIVSDDTAKELATVFRRPKFDKYRPITERINFLHDFLEVVTFIEITHTITACRDPRDNKFLELALSGNATLILTGDDDLRALHPWRNIQILSPADYLAR